MVDTEGPRPPVSYREKSAWISFISLLVVFGVYFWNVGRVLAGLEPLASAATLFFALVSTVIIAELVLHLVLAIRSPKEARTPRDERERLIELKATRVAFYVLVVGALLSIGTLHLHLADHAHHAWVMGHAVLFFLLAAGLVKFGVQIVMYRRDA